MIARVAAIPIRIRLVLGFAAVMALVLAATGAFVYGRTSADLDSQIEREQSTRLAGTVAIIRDDGDDLGDPVANPLGRLDDSGSVQVIGPGREIIDATSDSLLSEPLLDGPETRRLIESEGATIDVSSPVGPLRLSADRTQDDGVRYVAVAGTPLTDRNQTLESLRRVLLIGGPIALILAALAAYGVATAALRPVDAMRRRAAEISVDDPGQRLPHGHAKDEIADLAETLNGMLARLEGAIEQERRFAADASHELRTPLTILKSEVELALSEGRSPEELRSALESSSEEVDRLVALAGDLLVLARADEGRLPLRKEPVEIAPLVMRTEQALSSRIGGAGVGIDVPPGLEVDADPVRLEQALANLISNALAYGGGITSVSARDNGDWTRITVSDRGKGFPPDFLDRATERFARGNGRRNPGGTGLGLAIVRSIAEAHGGSVEVANRQEGGAAVSIVLPSAPASP